jgi:heat shock protein HslJ
MKRLLPLFLVLLTCACAQSPSSDSAIKLEGTSWQLVKFRGGDGTVLTPDDKAKYTIAFEAGGSVNVRFDCNRGLGTWRSSEPNQLEFGQMALTRAMCAWVIARSLGKAMAVCSLVCDQGRSSVPVANGRRRYL